MKIGYMNKTNTNKLTKTSIHSKSRTATTPGNMAVSTSDPEKRKVKVQKCMQLPKKLREREFQSVSYKKSVIEMQEHAGFASILEMSTNLYGVEKTAGEMQELDFLSKWTDEL